MLGLTEVIVLLLGLQGFGLQPNPAAPTADQSLQYAVSNADVIAHFDAASVIPGNYKALTQLADHPQVKASPELSRMVRKLVGEVEGVRGLARSGAGIDPTTDITDATAFIQIVPGQEPVFVAAVRGKFTPAGFNQIATMLNKQSTKVGSGVLIETGGPSAPALGLTTTGVLLAGTPRLVRERLADSWRAPARPAGSILASAADAINAKPVFALAISLSPAARKEVTSKVGSKNFLADVVARHKAASFAVFHDGLGWTWTDSSKAGLDSMAMMSDGMIDLMRAAQIAPRGLAKLILAGLDSYKGTSKQIDEIIRRKADILKVVETYSGDGNFKVQSDRDPRANRLAVRITGKSLSEVVPAALLLPTVGALVFFGARKSQASQPMEMPAPPPPRPGDAQPRPVKPAPVPRPARPEPPAKRP